MTMESRNSLMNDMRSGAWPNSFRTDVAVGRGAATRFTPMPTMYWLLERSMRAALSEHFRQRHALKSLFFRDSAEPGCRALSDRAKSPPIGVRLFSWTTEHFGQGSSFAPLGQSYVKLYKTLPRRAVRSVGLKLYPLPASLIADRLKTSVRSRFAGHIAQRNWFGSGSCGGWSKSRVGRCSLLRLVMQIGQFQSHTPLTCLPIAESATSPAGTPNESYFSINIPETFFPDINMSLGGLIRVWSPDGARPDIVENNA